ncbi:SGF29 tudor-like domain-containing protein [Spironucleus salmonicida]|uniref:SGF29 tudor-like domain-containing protein n=1 Tax=Spironucleus salmonicida TaxID=348837 RepID=V6LDQ9_9EUKA|nr:SGF29 tudor-like domain-containing protein [Spironucleus salmonicida]|eukprot:EST42622.1 hypothetical protein SS50377_17941 [Spironucleus salmonicida]
MSLDPGQSVIARVLIDNELQWMLAEIIEYIAASDQYVIMDLIPDDTSKQQTISASIIKKYPQNLKTIQPGQRLLSIWHDGTSWMSVLYPCQAIEAYQQGDNDENLVLKVRFDGVPQIQYVNASWVVCVD